MCVLTHGCHHLLAVQCESGMPLQGEKKPWLDRSCEEFGSPQWGALPGSSYQRWIFKAKAGNCARQKRIVIHITRVGHAQSLCDMANKCSDVVICSPP